MNKYRKLEKMISLVLEAEDINEKDNFFQGIEEDTINQCEKKLNVTFPESYRWLLKKYGHIQMPGLEVYGIISNKQNILENPVVSATLRYRTEQVITESEKWIVIEEHGDYIRCIKTEDNNNQGSVIILENYLQEPYEIEESESFYEYLMECVEDTLWDYYDDEEIEEILKD